MKKKISLLFLVTMFTLLFATAVSAATPSKVTGLKQTSASGTSIKVEWDALLDSGVYYEVSMSTDGINYTVVEDRQSSNYYYENYLNAGKSYYVRVRALYYNYSTGSTYGAYSDVLEVVTAPIEIENVVQTNATTNSLTISWDKVDGATSYIVYRKQNGNNYAIGSTTGTSYTVTGFNNKIEMTSDIYVYPVRSSGSYDAAPSYSKGIYDFNLKLVPTKVQNIHFTYYWASLKEVVMEFDKTVYSDGYVYEVYNYKNKKISSGTASSYSTYLKNITMTSFYKVRVRSYITLNNETIYGEWSDYKMFGQQPKVTIKKSGKGVKLSWKKVKGAKSYTVYVSAKEKSGFKKIKTLKKNTLKVTKFKNKKIKKNKKYYVYVVANTKFGKKTVKTPVSSVYWWKLY